MFFFYNYSLYRVKNQQPGKSFVFWSLRLRFKLWCKENAAVEHEFYNDILVHFDSFFKNRNQNQNTNITK